VLTLLLLAKLLVAAIPLQPFFTLLATKPAILYATCNKTGHSLRYLQQNQPFFTLLATKPAILYATCNKMQHCEKK
jgi:hypothetical protein